MLNKDSNKTTILVKKTTRDELAAIGSHDSNFDQIIQKLLEKWQQEQQ